MRIKELILENFRVYSGKNNQLSFNSGTDKPFSIIVGKSGSGKTTLWQALNYCFFGIDAVRDFKTTDKNWEPFSASCKESLVKNKKAFLTRVGVEISINPNEKLFLGLTEKDPLDYILWREVQYDEEKDLFKRPNDTIRISKIESGLREPFLSDSDAQNFIERLLPKNVRSYYFYDGAQQDIQTLAEDRNNVSNAISSLTGLDIASKIVEKLIPKYLEKNRLPETKDNKKLNDLYLKQSGVNENIANMKKNIDKEHLNIETKEEDLKDLRSEAEKDRKEKEKIEKITNLNTQLDSLIEKEKDKESEIIKFFSRHSWHILLNQEYNQLSKLIEKEIRENKWPKNVTANQVQELIDISASEKDEVLDLLNKKTKDTKDNYEKGLKYLEVLKEMVKGNSIAGHDVPLMKQDFDRSIQQIEMHKKDLAGLQKSIKDIKKEYLNKSKEIDEICRQYGIDKEIAIKGTIKKSSNILEKINNLSTDIRKSEQRLENFKTMNKENHSLKKQIEADINKELSKKGKNDVVIQRREFLNKVTESVRNELSVYKQKNKNDVEIALNKIYSSMWEKDKAIGEVSINDDYSISVKGNAGNTSNLSKGQKITLAVSFMMAISKTCTDYPPPIVIDAPVGNLDGDLGQDFYDILSQNDQCIFFLLPEREFIRKSEEGKFILSKSSDFYSIERNESTNKTSIIRE